MALFRFGVQLSELPSKADLPTLARRAEELGYSTFLVMDHLDGNPAPLLTLLAVADATTHLRIGTLVLNPAFRVPLMLARELALLDVLSGGRLEVGLGAGWDERDYQAAGIRYPTPAQRLRLVGELLPVLESLWIGRETTASGPEVRLDRARCAPLPVQQPRPPILLPLSGPKMIRLAAQHADIVDIPGRGTTAGEAVRRVQDLARLTADRPDRIEVSKAIAGLGPDVRRLEPESGRRWAERNRADPELPSMLVGGRATMVDTLRQRRNDLRISYVIVPIEAMETFAPVAEALIGT